MKKLLLMISCVVIVLLYHSNSSFALLNFDIGGVYGSKPLKTNSNYVNGNGSIGLFTFGMGIDLDRISSSVMLQLRFDVGFLDYSTDNYDATTGKKYSGKMYPIFVGVRFYFGGGGIPDWLVPYIELGYAPIIYSDIYTSNGVKNEVFLTNAAAGLGFEFFLYKGFFINLNYRVHFSQYIFWIINPSVGYRF